MKKVFIRLFGLLSILLFLNFSINPVLAQEGFEIDVFNVDAIVNEDGSIEITEELHVNFNERLHGIYANISSRYKMNWELDGKKVKRTYYFPVDNVEVLSGQFADITKKSNGVQIKLGDGDSYTNKQEVYRYRYTLHTKDLNLDDLQMLYLNIISNGWDTTIHKVNFTITMPKSFDNQKLQFNTGYPGQGDTGKAYWTLNGNQISGYSTAPLNPSEGLTVALLLDEAYFVFPAIPDFSLFILGGSFILLLVTLFIYLKFGHDDKVIPTVEFSAPEGVSSAEVGYIIDGAVDNRDIISLILDWGNRGYLRIEDDKETLTLSKLKDLPKENPTYEKSLFNSLFNKKDVITTKELETKFYANMQQAHTNITNFFSSKNHRIYTSTSKGLQAIYMMISALPIALLTASAINFNMGSFITALICFIVIELLTCCGIALFYLIRSHYYVYTSASKIALGILASILLIAVSGGGTLICLNFRINILYPITASLITVILSVISVFMVKRTPYGVKMFGKILGLRDFILTAENDRLKMLVDENPLYFYNILPYAYALGLTDVWSKHFENLAIPAVDWYYTSGDFTTYMMIHHLTHSMSRMQTSMLSVPAPEVQSGGGSIGGGGFGGGGFGGGGFGGSSGGGW